MRLRKECQHGRYDEHPYLDDRTVKQCPGGEFLPEDAVTGRLVDSKWAAVIQRRLWTLEMAGDIDASSGAEFVLISADQVGEPG